MEKLQPPKEFPFPFTPYSIQEDFMKALYTVLEERKLGIFESPTGTGKSLSLICGALTWLRDHEAQEAQHFEKFLKESGTERDRSNAQEVSAPFSWLTEQAELVEARQMRAKVKSASDARCKLHLLLSKFRQESMERKRKGASEVQGKKYHQACELSSVKEVNDLDDFDDDILLEDVNFEASENILDADEDESKEDEMLQFTKIYFCSRTHSQLTQFINEVQRSSFSNTIRLAPLASRQSYCINDSVNKLKSLTLMNERCLDFQKNSVSKVTAVSKTGEACKKARKATSSHCPAMNRSAIEMLSQDIISEVQDVEQIFKAGKALNACPYYASRASVEYSQVVVIPYNTLLHKSTREACGITLRNNIVIIDEAHNLLESIANIHSAQINGYQLSHSYNQLIQYRDKYQARFSAPTLLNLNQVIFILGKFIRILGGKAGCDPNGCVNEKSDSNIFTLPDFVISAEIDNLNLYKLLSFCKSSRLSQKLLGFSKHHETHVKIHKRPEKIDGVRAFLKDMKNSSKGSVITDGKNVQHVMSEDIKDHGNNSFLVVMGFLDALTNNFDDGRILVTKGLTVGKGSLKFVLLNPAAHFQDIVRQARSVIVAGGTMQPIAEFQNQLFISAGANIERIHHFSCGHVIPPENILPIVLGSGPSGKHFDFSYSLRDSTAMVMELGRLIVNLCNVVPAGIVLFFPSYEYENYVSQCLEKEGVIKQIENKKKIFREPKHSSNVEDTLSAYATSIQQVCRSGSNKLSGAILFSVIGGKLSEGINFSDDLGRCVMVIGLPFPNIKSIELQEQMKFLELTVGVGAGKSHYENLCMKAVNQSIGRAVRHKDDYATVILVDHRYLQQSRQSALPSWIQHSLQCHSKFGPAFREVNKFFQLRRS